ncbi:MAG: InlB B-repeat-containing protein [Clostridia bacterium]|nr:InlB B-repeat-containing protein [Clostridia bacterium]
MKKYGIIVLAVCLLLSFMLVGCNLFDLEDSESKEYKIIFVGTSIDPITIKDGSLTMPNDPVAEGKIFGGWYVDSACTIPFNQEYLTKNPLSGDLRVYPKWVDIGENTVILTLDVNEGNPLSDDTIEVVAGINAVQELPIPSRDGYNFVGWFTAKTNGEKLTDADGILLNYDGEEATIYAIWEEATYTITLGEVDSSIGNVSGGKTGATYLESITVEAVTIDNHYNFVGWFDGETLLSESMTYTFEATEDITLTARWLGEQRTIYFYRNYTIGDTNYDSYPYNYGSDISFTPQKMPGHSFIGWYDNQECVGEAVSKSGEIQKAKFDDGISLYAKWTEGHDKLNYNIIGVNQVEVTGIKESAGNVVYVPSIWGAYKVTKIADNAFRNSDKDAIVISSSINAIGENAFEGATANIYFDRGADLSLLNTDNFSASQNIYSHLINESENALLDGCYVEANGIFADDHIDSVLEAEAFYSYAWLYTYTEKFTLTIGNGVYSGDDAGFKDAMMGEEGLFKNLASKLMLKSDTASSFSYNTYDNKRQIYFDFDKKDSKFVASATTTGGKKQVQATSLIQASKVGSTHELYIDSLPEYLVFNSEQLVYAVEHGYQPIFGVENSTAEECYNKARDILATIINGEMSEFDKIKAIHDYIALNVTYDSVLLSMSGVNTADTISHYRGFNLEGALIDGKAVCDGITKTFMLLCRMEGIEAIRVSGSVKTPTGTPGEYQTIGHAWNKVKVAGVWYAVDVTNDDSILSIGGVSETYEILTHKFFMVSDSVLEATHTEDEDSTAPKATGNYEYHKNTKYDGINDLVIKSQAELNLIIDDLKALQTAKSKFYFVEVKFEGVNPENMDYSRIGGYKYLPYTSGSNAHYSLGDGTYLVNFLIE